MQRSIALLMFVLFIIAASLYLADMSGYVLIALPHWNLQTPLWVAFLLSITLFIIVYALLWAIRLLLTLNYRITHWLKHKKAQHGQQALRQGIFALLAEQFIDAKSKLHAAVNLHADPLFTQLALAFLAQQQGEVAKRELCFQQLQSENPTGKIELGILQARLQIESGDFTKALDKLITLRHVEGKYPAVLRLLAKVYYHQHQLTALTELLPILKKLQIVNIVTYTAYLGATTQDRLLNTNDKENLLLTWRGANELARQQYSVLRAYVQQLLNLNLTHEAEIVVRSRIEQQSSDELYLLYASIPADEHQQILQIETWLRRTPAQATLLFAAGQLCMRLQLWGKARDYLLASLQQKANAHVYDALAKLFEQLGDKDKAMLYLKQGLALFINAKY